MDNECYDIARDGFYKVYILGIDQNNKNIDVKLDVDQILKLDNFIEKQYQERQEFLKRLVQSHVL